MPRFNKRGSFGAESMTTPTTSSAPVQFSRPSVIAGPRGRDDANHVTQNMNSPATEDPQPGGARDPTAPEEYDSNSDISMEEVPSDDAYNNGSASRQKSPGTSPQLPGGSGSGPLHPGTILGRHKPALQRLEDLPGLSIVTWEEFLEKPSVLCGLFEMDRDEFIHHNAEQVNVFFHDSRMEQPTLGAPSGDGLSWTIFIDNYSHLRSVRSWLTERVSVILLHLERSKGDGAAACLVAINPASKMVGSRLNESFSQAVDSFLQQRNFCLEVNLNRCVQTWCRTSLQMACQVKGGRVVITNAEDRIPCSRVESVPFCVACFPVWGIRKLSYKYKRQSEYNDIVLAFAAEDLSFCTKSQTLKQSTENSKAKSNPAGNSSGKERSQRNQVWTKKNSPGASTTTQTSASLDKSDLRGNLEVQEMDSEVAGPDRRRPKHYIKGDKERGQDSGFSSDNTSAAERSESQLSKGTPCYRPHGYIPPRPSDKTRRESRGPKNLIDDASSTSANTSSYASSVLSPVPGRNVSTWGSTVRDGPAKPDVGTSVSWQVIQDVEEEDRDSEFGVSPTRDDVPGYDFRSADSFAHTLPVVDQSDGEGAYALLEEESTTPSPRPDTPYHRPVETTSSRGNKRPVLMSQGAVIREERAENGERMYSDGRAQLHRNTASSSKHLPGDVSISKQQRFGGSVYRQAEGGLYAVDNEAFEYDDGASQQLNNTEKGKHRPILKEKTSGSSKAFPYTSEYLDAMGTIMNPSPKYGLVDLDGTRGDELKKKKNASTAGKEPSALFAPRDNSQHQHNVHGADDLEDVEGDDVSVMTDEEDMMSSELGPKPNQTLNDAKVGWELADCDQEEDAENTGLPRILPGAKGAQQLRSSKEFPAHSASGEVLRRGGQQNDSRRRYIALNSLRRKSNQQALQSDLRKQKHSETPSSAAPELIEF